MTSFDHWRARIGWIQPRVCSDVEVYDFYQVAPEGVLLVTTNLAVVDSAKKEDLEASLSLLDLSVERLNMAGVDLIMQNGSPIHLHGGNEGHRRILERMRALAKAPVITSSQALAEAFQALSARRILLLSSWKAESTHLVDNLKQFLSASGIDIAAVEGIGRELPSIAKHQITPAEIYTALTTAAKKHPNVDALYIQSGTLATAGILERLEDELGKPVVSTNSAKIWGSFKPLGISIGHGFGRLLASL